MNLKYIFATGMLTSVAFATLAVMPANAEALEPVAKADGNSVMLALGSTDTPQHLVWDMTYGDQ